jgi:hypothetical protein
MMKGRRSREFAPSDFGLHHSVFDVRFSSRFAFSPESWEQPQTHPVQSGGELSGAVHGEAVDRRTAGGIQGDHCAGFDYDAKAIGPLIAPRIEQGDFNAGFRIGTGQV